LVSKKPNKTTASRAAKILRNPKASKAAKSAAGKTLAKRGTATRKIHPAPKKGKVSSFSITKAVKLVKSSKASSRRHK
jgi:hypothetical protein